MFHLAFVFSIILFFSLGNGQTCDNDLRFVKNNQTYFTIYENRTCACDKYEGDGRLLTGLEYQPIIANLTAQIDLQQQQIDSLLMLTTTLQAQIMRLNFSSFGCVPSSSVDVTNYASSTICSANITLPFSALTVAYINGWWQVNTNGGCQVTILFDSETPAAVGSGGLNEEQYTYVTNPHPISSTRSKILASGTHTVSYAIGAGVGTCTIYETSLRGYWISLY